MQVKADIPVVKMELTPKQLLYKALAAEAMAWELYQAMVRAAGKPIADQLWTADEWKRARHVLKTYSPGYTVPEKR